jgi:hypothetical protein
VERGQSVDVVIRVENAHNIDAFAFDIEQSNRILSFDSIPKTRTLTEGFLFVNGVTLPEPIGAVRIAAVGGPASVTGDGILLTLRYHASEVGLTTLTITNLVDDVEGAKVTAGVVTVRITPVPTETPTETPIETPTETPAIAPRPIVSIIAQSGMVGERITAYVLVQNTGRLRNFGFDVTQTNNILGFEGVDTQNTIISGVRQVVARPLLNPPGAIRVDVASIAARNPRKGVLLRIQYTAQSAGETVLRLTNLTGDLADARVSNVGGFVSIGARGLLGDVDLDGQVTGADVFLLLSYLARMQELTVEQLQLADCNQDGRVDVRDVQAIFNLSVGLPAEGRSGKVVSSPGFRAISANAISLPDIAIIEGETGTIDVSVSGASDVSSFSFEIVFDANLLEFVSANTDGTLSNDFIVLGNESTPGRAIIVAQGLATSISGSGILLQLKIRAKAIGQSSIAIENLTADLANATAQGGTVTILPSSVEATPTPISPTPTPVSPSVRFAVLPGDSAISIGGSGMVNILLMGVREPVTSYTFDFVYDSALMQYVSIFKTGTLSSNAQVIANEISAGKVRITGMPLLTRPITTDGILLQIEMRALGEMETSTTVGTENLQAGIKSAWPGVGSVAIIQGIWGDLNSDNMLDADDLLHFSQRWKSGATDESDRFDLNKDNVIDEYDLLELVERIKRASINLN